MIEISQTQIEDFFGQEFPGQPYHIGNGYWYVQAGKCLGRNLHYEYQKNQVHLHIEGRNWRGIRNYLWTHVMDTRVSHSPWGRQGCCWTLHSEPQTWDEVKEAFRMMAYIMDPHILKYERGLSLPRSEVSDEPVSADFVQVKDILQFPLTIPNYQRPYRWNTRNVGQLLDDIQENRSNGKLTYLIGTVILHKTEQGSFDIVDGQQRITTLLLLLKHLGYAGTLPQLKYNHTDSFAHIRANYDYIDQWLKSRVSNREEFLNYVLSSCQFVAITVMKLNEAFQMFESQNGRGKELEAYNLLKAYHIRAMACSSREDKVLCDQQWEDATMYTDRNGNHKDLLYQLFQEQLYRPRLWARGKDAYRFSKKHVDEFKGITIDEEHTIDFAYQNHLVQQEIANMLLRTMPSGLFKIKSRFLHGDSANINPFVHITQMILNGKAFFEYVETYVEIYKRLFIQLDSSQLSAFKTFYKTYCLYDGYHTRKGDGYLREVYKSAIMMTFDRFGEVGVQALYRPLYLCLYRFRLEKKQIRYETLVKHENTGWIFQTLESARTLSELQPIEHRAMELKQKMDVKYELPAVLAAFR